MFGSVSLFWKFKEQQIKIMQLVISQLAISDFPIS